MGTKEVFINPNNIDSSLASEAGKILNGFSEFDGK